MWTTRLHFPGVLFGVAAATSLAAPAGGTAPVAVPAALRVSPEAPDLKARPALAQRLRETPHNYFRFINRPFSAAVCRMFDDVRASLPDVNLHGDAHVEQYAVTTLGWGLTDFDDSARGPYVIDLVRFGVSLELASRQKGWGSAGWAFDDFLAGYRDALSNPAVDRPPARTVRSALAGFAFDHGLALRRAEAQVDSDPVSPSELEGDFETYVAAMRTSIPSLPATFFRIKAAGHLKTGIGSALDEKYLLRVEGRTEAEGDDQILEAKLVRTLCHTGCTHADAGPGRVALGMSLIGRAPFPYSGFFTHSDRSFWVHGWTDDYVELSIEAAFPAPRDLRQVAYDVGTQLGRAHPEERAGKAAPRAARTRLLASTRANEARIREAIDELTEATVEAWRALRGENPVAAAPPGGAPGVTPSAPRQAPSGHSR